MYHGLFDDKHRIINTTSDTFTFKGYYQSGIHERNILCKSCDNEILGSLEKYASIILFGSKEICKENVEITKLVGQDGLKVLHIESINYIKFKLFLLSILWRASISKHPFFKEIKLKEHEETLRFLIYNSSFIPENEYRVSLILFKDNLKEDIDKFISQPKQLEKGTSMIHLFYLNKLFVFFEVGKRSGFELFEKGNLKINNSIDIPEIDNNMFRKFLKKFYGVNLKENYFA
jgi:hypothetical protein